MKTVENYKANIEIARDAEELACRCVDVFIAYANEAIAAKNVFYVAISGGDTPRRFFELLGEIPKAQGMPWEKVHLFWVDERYVPPDSPWSNYKLASDTFLKKVHLPEENIHRIPTEHCDFNLAAKNYEETIRRVFSLGKKQIPQFDLIVLGMGSDGHTGSLFPNCYACFDTDDLACVVYVLDEKLNRVTLTHPVLCAAGHLAVLVSGEEKAAILKEVLSAEQDEIRYPIHIIWPVLHKVSWLADSEAARLL